MFLAWAAARTSLSRCSSSVSVWRTGCRAQSEWHLLLTLRRLSLYVMDSMVPPGVATVQTGNAKWWSFSLESLSEPLVPLADWLAAGQGADAEVTVFKENHHQGMPESWGKRLWPEILVLKIMLSGG